MRHDEDIKVVIATSNHIANNILKLKIRRKVFEIRLHLIKLDEIFKIR